MAMKKGSTTPPAYQVPKGHSKQVRGNVTSTTPANTQGASSPAVQDMLQQMASGQVPGR